MIQVLEREKSEHRKIQYASSKFPLKLWLEIRLRNSTICPQMYVWIEAKEHSTDVKNVGNQPVEYTHNKTGLGTGKSDHRKIQYASPKVPLKLWMEGRLRQSTICSQIYLWIEAKERVTNANNVGNRPVGYTLYDTGLVTGKIRPQEDSICLLKGPTRNMAGRLDQKVNNLPTDICMDRGEGAEHWQQQRR